MGEQIIYIKAFAGSEHVDDHKYCKAADIGQRNSGADHFVAKQDCCTDQDGNYRCLSNGSLDITKNQILKPERRSLPQSHGHEERPEEWLLSHRQQHL